MTRRYKTFEISAGSGFSWQLQTGYSGWNVFFWGNCARIVLLFQVKNKGCYRVLLIGILSMILLDTSYNSLSLSAAKKRTFVDVILTITTALKEYIGSQLLAEASTTLA